MPYPSVVLSPIRLALSLCHFRVTYKFDRANGFVTFSFGMGAGKHAENTLHLQGARCWAFFPSCFCPRHRPKHDLLKKQSAGKLDEALRKECN
jgi:hypothetical protein